MYKFFNKIINFKKDCKEFTQPLRNCCCCCCCCWGWKCWKSIKSLVLSKCGCKRFFMLNPWAPGFNSWHVHKSSIGRHKSDVIKCSPTTMTTTTTATTIASFINNLSTTVQVFFSKSASKRRISVRLYAWEQQELSHIWRTYCNNIYNNNNNKQNKTKQNKITQKMVVSKLFHLEIKNIIDFNFHLLNSHQPRNWNQQHQQHQQHQQLEEFTNLLTSTLRSYTVRILTFRVLFA